MKTLASPWCQCHFFATHLKCSVSNYNIFRQVKFSPRASFLSITWERNWQNWVVYYYSLWSKLNYTEQVSWFFINCSAKDIFISSNCLQLSFHFLIEIFQRWFKTLDRFHDSSISEEAKQTGFLPPNVIQMTKYSCWSAGQKIAIMTHSTTLLLYFKYQD